MRKSFGSSRLPPLFVHEPHFDEIRISSCILVKSQIALSEICSSQKMPPVCLLGVDNRAYDPTIEVFRLISLHILLIFEISYVHATR